ncbi:hypothetical protein [Caenispirillum bisanense]|uniref:Uncharacterized protein n=1 Tax=Caenispirillum bisanense TaxID=414052 RepID=A0A286GM60_9PROT|nr:hypothetical protein [Caenispirillum bisanense]SOD96617.1 hypothetical protein SAMN05421508_1066 [Caenispirillum bisanense]
MQNPILRLAMLVCSAEQHMKRQLHLIHYAHLVSRHTTDLSDEQIHRLADAMEIMHWSGQLYSCLDAIGEVAWMSEAEREGRDCLEELLQHSRPKASIHDHPYLALESNDDDGAEVEEDDGPDGEVMDENHPDWDFYKPDA